MAEANEVRLGAVLEMLHRGQMTTQQAASRVRTMHFPDHGPQPTAGERFTEHLRGDIPVHKPGCFAQVSSAYAAGKIDRAQYEALCDAAHQAMGDELKFSQDGNYTGIGDKVPPESVNYHTPGEPGHQCKDCYMYSAAGEDDEPGPTCTLVTKIVADGDCERWVPANGPA